MFYNVLYSPDISLITSNVGKTKCHLHHPPVITIFIGMDGMGYQSQSWVVNMALFSPDFLQLLDQLLQHFSAICWVNSPFFGDQIQWPSWRCQFLAVAQVVNKATRAATQMLHENLPPQKMGHKMKRSKPPSPDLPSPFSSRGFLVIWWRDLVSP